MEQTSYKRAMEGLWILYLQAKAKCLAEAILNEAHQKNIHPSQFFLAADNIALRQELFKTLKALNNQSELYFNECNLKRVNDLEKDNFYLRLY